MMKRTAQSQTAQTAEILRAAKTAQRIQAIMQAETQAGTPAKMLTTLTTVRSNLEYRSTTPQSVVGLLIYVT